MNNDWQPFHCDFHSCKNIYYIEWNKRNFYRINLSSLYQRHKACLKSSVWDKSQKPPIKWETRYNTSFLSSAGNFKTQWVTFVKFQRLRLVTIASYWRGAQFKSYVVHFDLIWKALANLYWRKHICQEILILADTLPSISVIVIDMFTTTLLQTT